MNDHPALTDPTPIAPPLDPAPLTDTEVAALVQRVGVDTLGDIAAGAAVGRRTAELGRPRAALAVGSAYMPAVYRAAALAAYDEETGR